MMIRGVKSLGRLIIFLFFVSVILTLFLGQPPARRGLSPLALSVALGASPHGTYTTSTSLCQLCHMSHDAPSAGLQHTWRLARIEEDNIDTTYTGTWITRTDTSRSAGSSEESSQTGAKAELTFSAKEVVYLATKTPASGRAQVYLDGQPQAVVDLYSVLNDYKVNVWQKIGLSETTHTIEIRVLGTKQAASSGFNVDLDALDIKIPKMMLMRSQSEKAVCYTCHAGTGSIFNVAEQFGETTSAPVPVSKHPVPQGTTLCSDCHSPHAIAEDWDASPEPNEIIRLLRSIYATFLGFLVRPSNSWLSTPEPANISLGLPERRRLSRPYNQCGSCHGTGSTLPGGDVIKYYDYGGVKHDNTSSVSADVKSDIACMSCHEWHASSLPKLLETTIAGGAITANDNNVCYACHIEPKIATYDATVSGDVHGATESTKTPGSPGLLSPYDWRIPQIRCVVCHNPHGARNVYWTQTDINGHGGISVDGTAAINRGQWENYCAACHTYTHDSTTTFDLCVTCHFHGAGADSSTTTRF